MAIKFIDDTILTAIANAIRTKLSSSDTYKPSEMATAIGSISGGITPTGTINITSNGTVDVTQYASASVAVAGGSMDKVTVSGTTVTQELTENKFYVFGEVSSLTITLATPANANIVNEYHFRFTSGSTATVLTLPNTVNMPSGFSVEASKVYEISIIDNYGTVTSW